MYHLRQLLLLGLFMGQVQFIFSQKINGEIFIPINNRSEIWLKPKLDTLENLKEYEFKIRVTPEFTISQFLFEKGLAVQNDSMLKIIPNSTKYGSYDTCTLRVIVTSIQGSRIMLFQKRFIVKVPEKMFPVLSNPKNNLMKVNDKVWLERNKPYSKQLFTDTKPFLAMYDNEVSMKKLEVKKVTVTFYEKEGKQYVSQGDTINGDAIKELKKLKDPTPVFFKVEAQNDKSRRIAAWVRVVVYAD